MIRVDGSRYSGSGAVVRQAVAFAALTGQDVHIVHARVKRPNPGLRPQHIRVVEAIHELVGGTSEGVSVVALPKPLGNGVGSSVGGQDGKC